MKKYFWMVMLAVLSAFATLSLRADAGNPRTVGPMDEKSALGQSLSKAPTCETQMKECTSKLDACNKRYDDLDAACKADYALFDQLSWKCVNMSADDYKKRLQNKQPVTYGTRAAVELCSGDAKLENGKCTCKDVSPLPGRTAPPVAVKARMSNGDFKWTCVYDSSEQRAVIESMDQSLRRICAFDEETAGVSTKELCEKGQSKLIKLTVDVEQMKIDADKLKARVDDLHLGLCQVCGCKDPTKPVSVTCEEWAANLEARLKGLEQKTERHDAQIADHEVRITKLEKSKSDSGGEWGIGAGVRYMARLKSSVPDSTQIVFVPRWGYWATKQFGFRVDLDLGMAINKTENRYNIGGAFLGTYAFSAEKKVILDFGPMLGTEIVPRGTDAANLLFRLGVELRPDQQFGIDIFGAFGGNLVTNIHDGVRESMAWGNAAAVGLTLTWMPL